MWLWEWAGSWPRRVSRPSTLRTHLSREPINSVVLLSSPFPPDSHLSSLPHHHLLLGEHAYKCSWCSFSTMTISQLKEHSLKVHGKALTLPRPRIVSLLSSHAHHSSQKATPAEEVEDSNGKNGLLRWNQPCRMGWAGINFFFFPRGNSYVKIWWFKWRKRYKNSRDWSRKRCKLCICMVPSLVIMSMDTNKASYW